MPLFKYKKICATLRGERTDFQMMTIFELVFEVSKF